VRHPWAQHITKIIPNSTVPISQRFDINKEGVLPREEESS
jgi:hypothetical protein